MAMHVHNCEDGRVWVGVRGGGVEEEVVSGFKQRPFLFLGGTISAKRARLSCPPNNPCHLAESRASRLTFNTWRLPTFVFFFGNKDR